MNDNPFLYDLDVMIIKQIMDSGDVNLEEVLNYFSGGKDAGKIQHLIEESYCERNIDYYYHINELERSVHDIIR